MMMATNQRQQHQPTVRKTAVHSIQYLLSVEARGPRIPTPVPPPDLSMDDRRKVERRRIVYRVRCRGSTAAERSLVDDTPISFLSWRMFISRFYRRRSLFHQLPPCACLLSDEARLLHKVAFLFFFFESNKRGTDSAHEIFENSGWHEL